MTTTFSWEAETYLTRKEVARILKLNPGTLANWASQGQGPPVTKMEGRACYSVAQLKAYLENIGLR